MKVVVTGSEGFLGRHAVARLAADGHHVIAVDRVYHRADPAPGVINHHADLSEPQYLLPHGMESSGPFTLVHLAWDMRRYEGYAIQAEQIRQCADLLDYWGERGLQRVLAMGSAEEYGGRSGVLAEDDPGVFPLSAYGWAKHSTRDLVHFWSVKTGIPCTWLRPFIMYGPGQRGDMLIPSAIEAARQKRKTQFTDGRQCRDFIFIADVVEAMSLAVRAPLEGFQAFNLGRGEAVAVADVLMAIARRYDAADLFELGARPRRPGEPPLQVADTTRARERLGWSAKVGWSEGLAMIEGEGPA